MKTIEKKRQFLKELLSGKIRLEDFNLITFEQKKLCLEMVSNENLEWLSLLYTRYDLHVKNGTLSTSFLTPEDLTKFKEIEKQFTYK